MEVEIQSCPNGSNVHGSKIRMEFKTDSFKPPRRENLGHGSDGFNVGRMDIS
jgi:hypothetical protein